MSTLKVNKIRDTAGSADSITLDPNGGAVIAGVTTISTARVTSGIVTNTFIVGAGVTISESGIEASGIGITVANINGGQIAGRRNIIINGAMQVSQRATSSTSSGYYTIDRFYDNFSGTDESPTQEQVDVASGTSPYTEGFRKAFKVTNGNQTSGAGAADNLRIIYKVEAQDLANSGWNYVSSSSNITLSFWVKSSVAQNFYVQFRTRDTPEYSYTLETGSLSADTWTKVTNTIPGNSNLVFANDNGVGTEINFWQFLGTDNTGSVTLNQWAAYSSSARTPDNTSTWYTTNDATFELTGVQLEVGSQATPFEFRSFGDELLLCQRYYQQIAGNTDNVCIGPGRSSGTTTGIFSVPLSVPLRASPTVNSIAWAFFTAANQTNVTATPTVDKWDAVSPVLTCYVSGLSGMTNARCLSAYSNSANTFTIDAEL